MSEHDERADAARNARALLRSAFQPAHEHADQALALELQGDVSALSDEALVQRFERFVNDQCWKLLRQSNLSPKWLDDARAYGFAGLLEARQRYVPSPEVTFTSFAYYRVRGSILDGLVELGIMSPRSVSRALGKRAMLVLQDERYGQPVDAAEEGDAEELAATGAMLALLRYDATLIAESRQRRTNPSRIAESKQRLQAVHDAIHQLPEPERTVVTEVCLEGRTAAEVAAALNVSQPWVSRLRARAVELLRAALLHRDL